MLFRQGIQHCFLERPTLLQAGYWPLEAPRPHVTGGASLGVLNCALADAQLSSLVPRRPGQDKEEMAEKATAPTSSLSTHTALTAGTQGLWGVELSTLYWGFLLTIDVCT